MAARRRKFNLGEAWPAFVFAVLFFFLALSLEIPTLALGGIVFLAAGEVIGYLAAIRDRLDQLIETQPATVEPEPADSRRSTGARLMKGSPRRGS